MKRNINQNKKKQFSPQFSLSLILSLFVLIGLLSWFSNNSNLNNQSQKEEGFNLPSGVKSLTAISPNRLLLPLPGQTPLKIDSNTVQTLVIDFTEPVNLLENKLTLTFNRYLQNIDLIYKDNRFFSNSDSPLTIQPQLRYQKTGQDKKNIYSLTLETSGLTESESRINPYKIIQIRLIFSSRALPQDLEILSLEFE
jgi:hypothetical protein